MQPVVCREMKSFSINAMLNNKIGLNFSETVKITRAKICVCTRHCLA